uniref:G protein-coupled receptor 87 n=1 Tax=Naja naja TaxID=35670 RepID=A0A8C6Y1Q5_NAJNA
MVLIAPYAPAILNRYHQSSGQDINLLANYSQDLIGNSANNEFTTIVLPILYLLIFLASIFLNSLAVWIFFHIRSKTSFILYLKNIVVADLLMTLTFPFKIIQDSRFGPWYFHFFLCRYTKVLFYASMYTTIVFLGLISLDRYLKVVKPFGDSRMYSINFTKILSLVVWIVMAFLALPDLVLTNSYPTRINTIKCKQFISSSSHKRKHSQSIRVVVTVFFICFVPYHLCTILFHLCQLDYYIGASAHKILYYCKEVTIFLSACNVCLDPIIYFFMCRSFSRRLFRKSNIRTRSESIRSFQSIRKSEVRIYHEYTDL